MARISGPLCILALATQLPGCACAGEARAPAVAAAASGDTETKLAIDGICAPKEGGEEFVHLRALESIADNAPKQLLPFLRDSRLTMLFQSSTTRAMRFEHDRRPVWQEVDELLCSRYPGKPHSNMRSAIEHWEAYFSDDDESKSRHILK